MVLVEKIIEFELSNLIAKRVLGHHAMKHYAPPKRWQLSHDFRFKKIMWNITVSLGVITLMTPNYSIASVDRKDEYFFVLSPARDSYTK